MAHVEWSGGRVTVTGESQEEEYGCYSDCERGHWIDGFTREGIRSKNLQHSAAVGNRERESRGRSESPGRSSEVMERCR